MSAFAVKRGSTTARLLLPLLTKSEALRDIIASSTYISMNCEQSNQIVSIVGIDENSKGKHRLFPPSHSWNDISSMPLRQPECTKPSLAIEETSPISSDTSADIASFQMAWN